MYERDQNQQTNVPPSIEVVAEHLSRLCGYRILPVQMEGVDLTTEELEQQRDEIVESIPWGD